MHYRFSTPYTANKIWGDTEQDLRHNIYFTHTKMSLLSNTGWLLFLYGLTAEKK